MGPNEGYVISIIVAILAFLLYCCRWYYEGIWPRGLIFITIRIIG